MTRPLVDCPPVRTVNALPAPPLEEQTRNYWPSFCEVCGTDVVWFPTQTLRREFEQEHEHGGVD